MAFYREYYLKEIGSRLIKLGAMITVENNLKIYDSNIIAEGIYAGLLNRLFGWKLTYLNKLYPNAAGVDLIDEDNRIIIKVCLNHEKMQDSLHTLHE